MKELVPYKSRRVRRFGLAFAALIAIAVAAVAAPAAADDHHNRAFLSFGYTTPVYPYGYYYAPRPRYYYAPPVQYYYPPPPPPAYYYSPGVLFGVTIPLGSHH